MYQKQLKKDVLAEIVQLQRDLGEIQIKKYLNTEVEVLIERESKKSNEQWSGKTSQNIVAVFPKENYTIGDLVSVKVLDCTKATLIGEAIGKSNNN